MGLFVFLTLYLFIHIPLTTSIFFSTSVGMCGVCVVGGWLNWPYLAQLESGGGGATASPGPVRVWGGGGLASPGPVRGLGGAGGACKPVGALANQCTTGYVSHHSATVAGRRGRTPIAVKILII